MSAELADVRLTQLADVRLTQPAEVRLTQLAVCILLFCIFY